METKNSDPSVHHRPSRLALNASTLHSPSKEITTTLRPLPKSSNNPLRHLLPTLRYHAYTIWLFTYSSHKDTVYPSAAFAISTALSTSFSFPRPTGYYTLLLSTLLSLLHPYLSLLLFSLHNQHSPPSIIEDSLNKPWRPLPSGRISPSQTRALLAAYYPLWLGASYYLGCIRECLGLTVLTWYYCEMGGCAKGGWVRNGLNAAGYGCFFAGGLRAFLFGVDAGTDKSAARDADVDIYEGKSGLWLVMICALIASTIHAQDFRDEEGDKARGRRTVQTALGDAGARWFVVGAAVGWSVVIPRVLGLGLVVMGGLLGVAGVLAWAMLLSLWDGKRTVERDVWAYKVWIGWFVAVILAPLMQYGWM